MAWTLHSTWRERANPLNFARSCAIEFSASLFADKASVVAARVYALNAMHALLTLDIDNWCCLRHLPLHASITDKGNSFLKVTDTIFVPNLNAMPTSPRVCIILCGAPVALTCNVLVAPTLQMASLVDGGSGRPRDARISRLSATLEIWSISPTTRQKNGVSSYWTTST